MPSDYPARLRELCDAHGILWVNDEVQSGTGRTGTFWAIEQYENAEPDMVVFGKSIGGGLPLAGVTGGSEVMDAVPAGGLGGTFGGNPLSCAAALAVLDEVASPGFRARADEVAARIRGRLETIAERDARVGEVRGLGAMLAIELVAGTDGDPDGALAQAVVAGAFDRGLILLACGLYGNVVRILVPILADDEDLDRGLDILEECLGAAAGTG
jgi:4-aminobutyrate aminotransferase-like enzyme